MKRGKRGLGTLKKGRCDKGREHIYRKVDNRKEKNLT